MLYAATTSKYVFDLKPGDIYWCAATTPTTAFPCSRALSAVPEGRSAVHSLDALDTAGALRTVAGSRGTAT